MYNCTDNPDCMDPGNEYCAKCSVHTILCVEHAACEVTCNSPAPNPVDMGWENANMAILPVKKKAGQPVIMHLTDSRDGSPLLWKADVYEVKGSVTEEVWGAIHVAEGKWAVGGIPDENGNLIPLSFNQTRLERGEKVTSLETDCQGEMKFTPTEPGYYMVRTTRKDFAFLIGDSQGNTFTCNNSVCETALGENIGICPKDCKVVNQTPTPVVVNETIAPPPAPPVVQEPPKSMPVQQGNNDLVLWIIVILLVVVIIALLLVLLRKSKKA